MADVWHGASCLQRVGQRTQNSTGLATWSDRVEMWLALFWDITGVLCGQNETLAPTSCGLLVVVKSTDRKLPDRCIPSVNQASSTHARVRVPRCEPKAL